jgi:hypothetical protein
MRRYFSIIVFLFGFYFCHSQTLLSTLAHDTCLNKRFSIAFYIVLDSNYSVNTANQATLNAIIDTLNKTFRRICVSFQQCKTVYIPNYPYNKWSKAKTDPVVTNNWYTENTINFYIVDSVKDVPTTERGYAYPPANPGQKRKDVIVVEQHRFYNDFFYMLHNFGHFFGLSDTYTELNAGNPATPLPVSPGVSQEFADGSNNPDHGDKIPDTEADPGPIGQEYDGKLKRYIRPIDNFMSFLFPIGCKFTQQQYNTMARHILTKRLYLH